MNCSDVQSVLIITVYMLVELTTFGLIPNSNISGEKITPPPSPTMLAIIPPMMAVTVNEDMTEFVQWMSPLSNL